MTTCDLDVLSWLGFLSPAYFDWMFMENKITADVAAAVLCYRKH